ncbi:DMT family transporter [Ferrovibrio terrae]|jgi:drug/metabolite transporter (DMT)-like permease|uniref:DMT family transporter n=1 Tax=Ferrovibrio terrae TaxID=2594003 RepID=UPI003137E399
MEPAASSARDLRIAQILLFITPAMFTTNMVMARATAGLIPPVALAELRWIGVVLVLLPFCGRELWRARAAILREWKEFAVLGFLGMGICGGGVYYGAATTTATNIGLIYATSPVMIILLSRMLFAERFSLRQGLGTALALTGVLAIILRGDPATILHLTFTPGDLIILVAAAAWALYSVLLKHWPSRLSVSARLATIAFAGVLVVLPVQAFELAVVGPPHFDLRTIAAVVTLILVPGVGAYATFGYMTKHLGPNRTGLMLYLSPVYTAIMAWLLLGEVFAFYHWLGTALVLPGLYFATHKPDKP